MPQPSESAPKFLVRTSGLDWSKATRVCHPLNPRSDVRLIPLGEQAGMTRAHLSIGRLPPGKESFAFHAHAVQEEFLFILEGTGEADIGDATVPVGPGDYMGFPTDGTGHLLRNTGSADLVYLMGGERSEVEVAEFPRSNVTLVAARGHIHFVKDEHKQAMRLQDFLADPDGTTGAG